jgi:hypothetical protein
MKYRKIGVPAVLVLILTVCGMVPALYGAATAIPSSFYLPNLMPFGAILGNGTYQQVYDATLFPGKITITGLGFVPGADYSLPGFFAGTYKVSFSVTSKPVCGLDGTDLSANIGLRQKVVFNDVLDGGESISDLKYTYDPADGNLLINVEITNKVPNFSSLQGAMWRGPECQGSSRAYNFPEESTSGADNVGLVTIFTYVPKFELTGVSPAVQQLTPWQALTPSVSPTLVPGDIKNGSVIVIAPR